MDQILKKMIINAQDIENIRYPLFLILDDTVKMSLGNSYTLAEVIPMSKSLAAAFKKMGISELSADMLAQLDKHIKKMANEIPDYGGAFLKKFSKALKLFAQEILSLKK